MKSFLIALSTASVVAIQVTDSNFMLCAHGAEPATTATPAAPWLEKNVDASAINEEQLIDLYNDLVKRVAATDGEVQARIVLNLAAIRLQLGRKRVASGDHQKAATYIADADSMLARMDPLRLNDQDGRVYRDIVALRQQANADIQQMLLSSIKRLTSRVDQLEKEKAVAVKDATPELTTTNQAARPPSAPASPGGTQVVWYGSCLNVVCCQCCRCHRCRCRCCRCR